MDELCLPAVAARVVAWHNRHPLARRIGAAQVHSIGYVVLPFVTPMAPGPGPGPEGPVLDGPVLDASVPDGPVPDGPVPDGPALEVPALEEGQAPERPGPEGPPADGPVPQEPDDGGSAAGSLRTRTLARAGLACAVLLRALPKAAPADTMPAGAQANFDENFIAPLTPRQIARWARRHGRPLPQTPPADAPLRQVVALPLAPGQQALQVLVLTAAIEVGAARHRVLLGTGGAVAVLGRRVPSLERGGLLLGLWLAASFGAMMLPADQAPASTAAATAAPALVAAMPAASTPMLAASTPMLAASTPMPALAGLTQPATPAASAPLSTANDHAGAAPAPAPAPASASASASASAPTPTPTPTPSPSPARASAAAIAAPAAPAAATSPTAAPAAATPTAPGSAATTSAPAASAGTTSLAAAPAATVADVEPRLGRVELPPLDLPRKQGAKAAARDAWLSALGVPAMPPPDEAASSAAASPAPKSAPPAASAAAAAGAIASASAVAFAVTSRLLRTRAEAEQVRDAMQGLLQIDSNSHRGSADPALTVDVLPQGDDFRVVGWPFGQRAQAERARIVLVSRGMRVDVVPF